MLNHIFTNSNLVNRGDTYSWQIYLASADRSNFRYDIAKTKPYKGNRTAPKPKHFDAIREYLVKHWRAEIVTGQEADDALGIAQCSAPPRTTVICSNDKDLDMIPGLHWNFVKGNLYTVTPGEALYNFYKQVLTGDTSDNIPGLKGIGPKKAEAILDGLSSEQELYDACLEAYDGNTELMHEMCRLLWIRRYEDQYWQSPKEEYDKLDDPHEIDDLNKYDDWDLEEYK